jgi:2-oxoglutarate ferredoxin oxidoreductase subunit beta
VRCGDFAGLASLAQALSDESVALGKIVTIGSPSCAMEAVRGIHGFRVEAPDGLAVPMAVGVALARPELGVILVTGDVGGVECAEAQIRDASGRRVSIVHVVFNNQGAGSTAGALRREPSAPRPAEILLGAGVTFLATAPADDLAVGAQLITKAMRHRGYAAVVFEASCPTFFPARDDVAIGASARAVPASHEAWNRDAAARLLASRDVAWAGVVFESLADRR